MGGMPCLATDHQEDADCLEDGKPYLLSFAASRFGVGKATASTAVPGVQAPSPQGLAGVTSA